LAHAERDRQRRGAAKDCQRNARLSFGERVQPGDDAGRGNGGGKEDRCCVETRRAQLGCVREIFREHHAEEPVFEREPNRNAEENGADALCSGMAASDERAIHSAI
jgi:hypothetical protein